MAESATVYSRGGETMQPVEGRTSVPETIIAAMRQTNELFDTEVIQNKNYDALDRVYTRQARILPPGVAMIEGREQIKGFWKQAVANMGLSSVKLTIVDAQLAGDGVIEIGRAELTVADGQVVKVKYVVCWKQEDGGWKWNIDVWNPNQ
jgi:ketosteroid isomerase-like protein